MPGAITLAKGTKPALLYALGAIVACERQGGIG